MSLAAESSFLHTAARAHALSCERGLNTQQLPLSMKLTSYLEWLEPQLILIPEALTFKSNPRRLPASPHPE